MLREYDFQGNPLEALVRGPREEGAGGLFQVGGAVGVLAAGGQGKPGDDAALAPEGLSHTTKAVVE